jgi:hypothetical protein
MMAACQNVQTYAAAQVFYWVGYVTPYKNTHRRPRVIVHDNLTGYYLVITVSPTAAAFSSPTRLLSRTERSPLPSSTPRTLPRCGLVVR